MVDQKLMFFLVFKERSDSGNVNIKELVEEHAKTNRVTADLVTGINGIKNKIDKPSVIHTQEPDTGKFEQIIEKSMLEIKLTIGTSLNKYKPGGSSCSWNRKINMGGCDYIRNLSADIPLFFFLYITVQVSIIALGEGCR